MKSRVRPARPLAPMAVAAAVLGTWWLVAHNSGAGWVQVLGDVAFGTIAIGIIGPAVVLARANIRISRAPTDGTAGMPVEVEIDASTRLRVRPVAPAGVESFAGPVRTGRRTADTVTLLPQIRGAHEVLVFDIATAAPFALQWWTRRVSLPLPSRLHVAPRRGRPVRFPLHPREQAGDSRARASSELGEPRGARPYRPGDDRRHVHWRAYAHTGELMVREVEGPAAEPVTVWVALPPDPEAGERVAERGLGTVASLLERGAPVVLGTCERDGPVLAPVADREQAGRRLACAVSPPDGSDPDIQAASAVVVGP